MCIRDRVNKPDSTTVPEKINNEANKSDGEKNEESFLSKIFSFNGIANTIFIVIFIYTFLLGASS